MNRLPELARVYGVLVALILLVIGVTSMDSSFLAYQNQVNILSQWAPVGIMAVGMTFVIITGGFDLSIGAIYTISAVTAAGLGRGNPTVLAFLAGLALATALGLLNGALINFGRINPFIATLGTSFAIAGATLLITNNVAFIVTKPDFATLGSGRFHGFPYSGMLLIGALVVGGLALSRTVFGQSIYAVGGNAEASRLAGLRTHWVSVSAYALSGLTAGLGGIISASQLSSAQPTQNSTIVFDVITVVVVGGTSLTGGYGAVWRTAVGIGILATVQNWFNLQNINPNYQSIVKGLIIVGALALDSFAGRLSYRKAASVRRRNSPPTAASDTEGAGPSLGQLASTTDPH
jgi:ribose transport system permease protein